MWQPLEGSVTESPEELDKKETLSGMDPQPANRLFLALAFPVGSVA